MSTFAGIEMGRQALNAFRLGMQTVGHNIANMGTEGYSRQRVDFSTVQPMNIQNVGQLGQGMKADEIIRIRDEFLDFQFRNNQTNLGYWEKINDLYNSIQNYISEPTSEGIRSAMNTFFTSMQTLQQSPEDTSARRNLVESANSLSDSLSNLINSLDTYNQSINLQIQQSVSDANDMLHDVAALNKEIYHAESLGQNANDLRDKRDVIVDKLSKMMDITYSEPIEKNNINGEFFLTLNGRVLVQGDKVRELKAHAFQWDNQVYYDVQVAQNEFDIIDNCSVADVLATGNEGTYQLTVDRVANGVSWTVGGGDAHCLETRSVQTSYFQDGIILDENSDRTISRKLSFRTLIEPENSDDEDLAGQPVILNIQIDWDEDSEVWQLRAKKNNGEEIIEDYSSDETLTVSDLETFIADAIDSDTDFSQLHVEAVTNDDDDNAALKFWVENEVPLEFTDYSGMLGALSTVQTELTDVNMRNRPMTESDSLNISGSFRIQVGTQGTRVTSNIFRESSATGLESGVILGSGNAGDKHTFRIGVADSQVDISATWNDSTKQWVLSSDLGNPPQSIAINSDDDDEDAEGVLTVEDVTNFINETIKYAAQNGSNSLALNGISATAGPTNGTKVQFYIESKTNNLISISDVQGNLAEKMGIVNKNPVITIDVNESDSLITIRNKINEKYQEELGLNAPEQWVHASIVQDSDQSYYLTIASDVAGEAQRITLMGAEDGNMQVLRRLGLTSNELIKRDEDTGVNIYREISAIPSGGVAQDASFTLNGVRYLSSENMFNTAKRVPAVGGTDYSASTLSEIADGMWLNLKNAGIATITVKHHVRDGSIKALEESRDYTIPEIKSELDLMAYDLINNINAYNYSGYGIASRINTTGTAFFNNSGFKANAAETLSVNEQLISDNALIGAAMGLKNANGIASSGISGGSGDGTNASRMNNLNWSKISLDGTTTIGGIYDSMLSQIGSNAAHATLMYSTEATVSEQIDAERQSISGVNIDEELMSMVILNRAFGAMSRYITAMDEMLNTLINGFGLVGR